MTMVEPNHLTKRNRGFTPPNLRNHLVPQVPDTLTASAASIDSAPSAINSQNCRCTDTNE